MDGLDGDVVAAGRQPDRPAAGREPGTFIGMFSRERFLSDYADDGKLLFRLNQVMRRVGLPLLPPSTGASCSPELRPLVTAKVRAASSQRPMTQHATQPTSPEISR